MEPEKFFEYCDSVLESNIQKATGFDDEHLSNMEIIDFEDNEDALFTDDLFEDELFQDEEFK